MANKVKNDVDVWVVTALSHNAILTPDNSTIEVTGEENAAKVANLMKFLGSAAHYYPKGYYPEFDDSGTLDY